MFRPAMVLGPVIGWLRLWAWLPVYAAMRYALDEGGLTHWGVVAATAACGAVVAGGLGRVRARRCPCLIVNFCLAMTCVVMGEFWELLAGSAAAGAVLGGVTAAAMVAVADALARRLLAWCTSPADAPVPVEVSVCRGRWVGYATANAPVLLSLANGKGGMLWAGYHYAWRLSQPGYAPVEMEVAIGLDGETGENGEHGHRAGV